MADAVPSVVSGTLSDPYLALVAELLEGWDRQVRIFDALAGLVTDATRGDLPTPDGWPIDRHLAHVHNVRMGWLGEIDPARAESARVFSADEVSTVALDELRAALATSAASVRALLAETVAGGTAEPYTHPLHYVNHMIWHEGWHAGLISTALRVSDHAPTEEWEEEHVWSVWRFGVPTPWTG